MKPVPSIGTSLKKQVHKSIFVPHEVDSPLNNARVGIEIEVENYLEEVAIPNHYLLEGWEVKGEGSLRDRGAELVSVGGRSPQQYEEEIRNICEAASVCGWDTGYPRAGIHIHVDCTDLGETNPKELANLVELYLLLEKALFRYSGWWRIACGFCDPLFLSKAHYKNISWLIYNKVVMRPYMFDREYLSKYQGINFLPLARFGTIEFRHLETTFNPDRILNWINILLAIKAFALNSNESTDVVRECKASGLTAMSHNLLGKWAAPLAPFMQDNDAKDAIECIHALRYESQFTADTITGSWDTTPNALLAIKTMRR